MSSPLRALLMAAALVLAWSAGRSELVLRDWREWREWRQLRPAAPAPALARPGPPLPARPGPPPPLSAGAPQTQTEEPLLRALALLAEALARREADRAATARTPVTAPGPGWPPALPAMAHSRDGAGDAALVRAMSGIAREGAADRAALAEALSVLALALAARERGDTPGPQAGVAAPNAPPARPAPGGRAARVDGPDPARADSAAAAGPPAGTADPPGDSARHRAAWALADRGYAALQAGERRTAADSFAGALALAPDHPQARTWQREQRRLTRVLRLDGYSLLRPVAEGSGAALGATPALGAGGAAATLALRPRPLARRPVDFYGRYALGQTAVAGGIDPETAQVALGVAWRPVPRANALIAVERLIAAGALARDDWALRVAGGREARVGGITLSGYGEAGIIPDGPDWFAGGQASAEARGSWRSVNWAAGAGLWSAGQASDGQTLGRVDIGPLLRLSHPSVPAVLQIDYRLRAAGDVPPGSGPTVTIASSF